MALSDLRSLHQHEYVIPLRYNTDLDWPPLLHRHNKRQKTANTADLLKGVQLPDRLHTLTEPAPPARALAELPPRPTADQRPQLQLLSPPNTAGTSHVRQWRRRPPAAEMPAAATTADTSSPRAPPDGRGRAWDAREGGVHWDVPHLPVARQKAPGDGGERLRSATASLFM